MHKAADYGGLCDRNITDCAIARRATIMMVCLESPELIYDTAWMEF